MRHLIIGGGIAGVTAAEELRKLDRRASITLVSEEPHRPYSRVMLPHYIRGRIPRERCFIRPERWHLDAGIEWLRGERAIELDVGERMVRTDGERRLHFDRLLIATAGKARQLPESPDGVSYLRTLMDADRLLSLLGELPDGTSVGVLGGSFIAVEYLNIFLQRELQVDLFIEEEQLLGRIISRAAARVIHSALQRDGVRIHPFSHGTSTMCETRLSGVRVRDSLHPLSLLGVGIGIRPELEWLSAAGVSVQRGVVTNRLLETSVPGIFAAGDVAEFYDPLAQRHVVGGNWLNAQMQGRIAAQNMAGRSSEFSMLRTYSTSIHGIDIIAVGDTDPQAADSLVAVDALHGGLQAFVRGGRIAGVSLVNLGRLRAEVSRLVLDGAPVDRLSALTETATLTAVK